ncbi:MAG: NosD domain-containing protein, partial [Candidatus Bathyarchaeia archaeon]
MKRTFLAVLLVILLLSAAAWIFRVDLAKSSQIWTVDDDGPADFNTIQGAIDSSLVVEGDTVYVHNGTYREHVFLNKSISLVGQNPLATIIDGNASEYFPALVVSNATNIVVKNFTVQNTTASSEAYGILVYRTRNLTMQNMIATNAYYGVLINNSTQCRILDNAVRDNYNSGIVFRGNSSHNIIVGNLISDNPTGIYIESYSEYNVFYRNNIVSNTEHQFNLFPPTYTSWDNGAEGNYWSDYAGIDVDGDGIGETGVLPHLGVDSYPLIELWNQTRTYTVNSYRVVVSCNYTVASFAFNDTL